MILSVCPEVLSGGSVKKKKEIKFCWFFFFKADVLKMFVDNELKKKKTNNV